MITDMSNVFVLTLEMMAISFYLHCILMNVDRLYVNSQCCIVEACTDGVLWHNEVVKS